MERYDDGYASRCRDYMYFNPSAEGNTTKRVHELLKDAAADLQISLEFVQRQRDSLTEHMSLGDLHYCKTQAIRAHNHCQEIQYKIDEMTHYLQSFETVATEQVRELMQQSDATISSAKDCLANLAQYLQKS
jgi:hypothetical protein